jgi:hypothetical protein
MSEKSPEQRAQAAERRRERIAADPELKARIRDSQRRYRERTPRVLSEDEKERARQRAALLAYNREWAARNREKANAYSKKWRDADPDRRAAVWIKSRHGLTDEQYDEILAHVGLCDACGAEFGGRIRRHIDHDHETGAFRGLLCGPCNQAAGLLRDSPERARKLGDYLDRVTGPNRPAPGPRQRAASRP